MQGSWRLPRVEDRARAGATDPSWAPAPHPHPPASSSWPSPGARPTLVALLPAPARGAYERYVRSGTGRRPGPGDKGARASTASPPPHIAQPGAAATSSWILVKLDSDVPRLKFGGPGFGAPHSLPLCTVPQAQGGHISYSTLCLGDPPSACDAFFSYPPCQSVKFAPQALLLLPASFPLRLPLCSDFSQAHACRPKV